MRKVSLLQVQCYQAAIKFAESKPGRKTLITLLEKAKEGLSGKTGTLIENKES